MAKLAVAKRALAVSPVSAQLVPCEASSQQQSARVSSSVSRARSGSTCCCTDETMPRTKVAISVSSGVLKIFKSAERETAAIRRQALAEKAQAVEEAKREAELIRKKAREEAEAIEAIKQAVSQST